MGPRHLPEARAGQSAGGVQFERPGLQSAAGAQPLGRGKAVGRTEEQRGAGGGGTRRRTAGADFRVLPRLRPLGHWSSAARTDFGLRRLIRHPCLSRQRSFHTVCIARWLTARSGIPGWPSNKKPRSCRSSRGIQYLIVPVPTESNVTSTSVPGTGGTGPLYGRCTPLLTFRWRSGTDRCRP